MASANIQEPLNHLGALPQQMAEGIHSNINLDTWGKLLMTDRQTNAIVSQPHIMRNVIIQTRLDIIPDAVSEDPNLFGRAHPPAVIGKLHVPLIRLARAGNIHAQARVVYGWNYSPAVLEELYPGLVEEITKWIANPKVVPLVMARAAIPAIPTMERLYAELLKLPGDAGKRAYDIYTRVIPFPKLSKFVPVTNEIKAPYIVIGLSWMYEVCATENMCHIFTLARHLFLWCCERLLQGNTIYIQLYIVSCIRIAAYTVKHNASGEDANSANDTAFSMQQLSAFTANTFSRAQILHCVAVICGSGAPIDANVPIMYEGELPEHELMCAYPMFFAGWSPKLERILGWVRQRNNIGRQLLALHAELTVHDHPSKHKLFKDLSEEYKLLCGFTDELDDLIAHPNALYFHEAKRYEKALLDNVDKAINERLSA